MASKHLGAKFMTSVAMALALKIQAFSLALALELRAPLTFFGITLKLEKLIIVIIMIT